MRINELLTENQSLDELNLASVGRGIGAAAGALGRGVGNIQGAWQGAKAAFNQNRAPAANKATRNVAHGGGAQVPRNVGGVTPTPGTAYPARSTAGSDPQVTGGEVASNNLLARARQGTAQDPANQQTAAPATTAPAAQTSAPAGQTAAPADMKASEIVNDLRAVWDKATASQGSQTSAPAVQQQIRAMAKSAAMTGQTISEKFSSKFLGMDI